MADHVPLQTSFGGDSTLGFDVQVSPWGTQVYFSSGVATLAFALAFQRQTNEVAA